MRVALAGGSGSGDASSILKGGGEDLTRSAGQVQRSDQPVKRQTINLQAARAELKRQETEKLKGLKKRFEDAIQQDQKIAQFKNQIRLEITRRRSAGHRRRRAEPRRCSIRAVPR